MRRILAVAASATVVVALAGSGAVAVEPAAGKRTTEVQVRSSQYGDVLFDGKGFVLYLFTKDRPDESRCKDHCVKEWPPFLKRGRLTAGSGVDASALGVTERKDGSKQVTYEGRPLYYWRGDNEPGEIGCHDVTEFGGDWLVVQPDGSPAP